MKPQLKNSDMKF